MWASIRRALARTFVGRRPRMPLEVRAAFERATKADPPMPSDDAPEVEWDAWANLQEVQLVLAGWPTKYPPDRWLSDLLSALELPGVRELMGSAADDAIVAGNWIARTTPDLARRKVSVDR